MPYSLQSDRLFSHISSKGRNPLSVYPISKKLIGVDTTSNLWKPANKTWKDTKKVRCGDTQGACNADSREWGMNIKKEYGGRGDLKGESDMSKGDIELWMAITFRCAVLDPYPC